MLKTDKDYTKAMKTMIRRIQAGDTPSSFIITAEDCEILAECIKAGYINGTTTYTDINGNVSELRTCDGTIHPTIYNNIITLKGLEFLKPNYVEIKANLAIAISALALLISLLSNLDKIIENLKFLF